MSVQNPFEPGSTLYWKRETEREAERANKWEKEADKMVHHAFRHQDRADRAEGEAASLREAAQEVLDAVRLGQNSRFTEACTQLRELLQSAPPASEPSTEALGREAYPQAYSPAPADTPVSEPEGIDVPPETPTGDAHPLDDYPAPADRPEPPLREGAMRAAAGYDSPHADGDRPEPTEALADFETVVPILEKQIEGMNHFEAKATLHRRILSIRQALSQPAPAVPPRISPSTDRNASLADLAYVNGWNACRESTLATHPADGDSPAVVGGWKLVPKEDYQAHTKMARHFVAALPSDLRPERGSSLEPFVAAMYDAIAAAPTPTDDGEKP